MRDDRTGTTAGDPRRVHRPLRHSALVDRRDQPRRTGWWRRTGGRDLRTHSRPTSRDNAPQYLRRPTTRSDAMPERGCPSRRRRDRRPAHRDHHHAPGCAPTPRMRARRHPAHRHRDAFAHRAIDSRLGSGLDERRVVAGHSGTSPFPHRGHRPPPPTATVRHRLPRGARDDAHPHPVPRTGRQAPGARTDARRRCPGRRTRRRHLANGCHTARWSAVRRPRGVTPLCRHASSAPRTARDVGRTGQHIARHSPDTGQRLRSVDRRRSHRSCGHVATVRPRHIRGRPDR